MPEGRWSKPAEIGRDWKTEIAALLRAEDYRAVLRVARRSPARMLRYLSGRLYSEDPDVKWSAVRALGAVAADPDLVPEEKLAEQVRRYFWALNDESGAVPYGIPEAIGEILARRPSLQESFLPLLCSLAGEEEVSQTGAIERGVVWAIGRVGGSAARCDAEVVRRIRGIAAAHPDLETRRVAEWTLGHLEGACSRGLPADERQPAIGEGG